MNQNVQHFYITGNTASGYVDLLQSSLQGLRYLAVLKGGSKREKSALIERLAKEIKENQPLWILHSPVDQTLLEGMIAPGLQWGIVDESPPHHFDLESDRNDLDVQYIDWASFRGAHSNVDHQNEIHRLNEDMMSAYEQAHQCFRNALRVHDEWEAVYIRAMNFRAADELTEAWNKKLFNEQKRQKKSRVDHRFLGAATPIGANDFMMHLTNDLPHRYFIKGRPGSGKSTMLKKLVDSGLQKGFDLEIYHCGFDPDSLDMLIVRELGFAIFDSTAPHEYDPDPNRTGDQVIDMYPVCFPPGTDEENEPILIDIAKRYKSWMKKGAAYLANAKQLREQADELHVASLLSNHQERFILLKDVIKFF